MMGIERRLNTAVGAEKKKNPAGRPRRSSILVDADSIVSGGKESYEAGSAPDILCKVALDLFASQNFSTVTIKDIADASGLNASLIYYYFGNKEGLFMKAIERTVEEAFAHYEDISRNADAPDKLIGLWMELHVRQFVTLQKVAKMSLDYANTQNHTPATDRAIKALYDKEAKLLGATIQRGIVEGMFRPVNPTETAAMISTFLDGALFRNAMFPNYNYAQGIRAMRKVILTYLAVGK
ncbi:AcrR family transcriptional regulator [Ancylobacter sp. 3268]|nr:AcrR family transcriptional regulator [Ancylobacter sp. 3268]